MTVVMGIETSCDETGVGFVKDGVLLGDALASSIDEHVRFGGVVPEIAARAHVQAMVPTMRTALEDAGLAWHEVGAVAVTAGPGLATALHVGVAAAKATALALGVPLYGVHHLAGHAAADTLVHGPLPDAAIVLIVSGGHTSLLAVDDLVRTPIVHLSDTLDDAAGEAFDKVARLLGLPYPGGPSIDRVAREGDPAAVRVHPAADAAARPGARLLVLGPEERGRPLRRRPQDPGGLGRRRRRVVPGVRRRHRGHQGDPGLPPGGRRHPGDRRRRRGQLAGCARWPRSAAPQAGIELRVPPMRLCTDNGAMIAAIGDLLVRDGARPSLPELGARSSVPLELAHWRRPDD